MTTSKCYTYVTSSSGLNEDRGIERRGFHRIWTLISIDPAVDDFILTFWDIIVT